MKSKIKKILSTAGVLSVALLSGVALTSCDDEGSETSDVDLSVKKAEAITSVSTYKDKGNYKEAQKTEIETIISEATTKINASTSVDAINSAVSEAKTKLDAVKTSAQIDAENVHTHVYGNWSVTTAPTETTTGLISRTCSTDNNVETAELPVLTDTSYTVTITKAATCEEKGTKTYTYTKDGQDLVVATVEIAALGHNYGEWSVKVAPTAEAKGSLKKTCSTCGKEETFDLPVLTDTSYTVTTTKAATCEEKGTKTYTYTKDGQDLVVATVDIAALGHNYGEWSVKVAPTAEVKGSLKKTCSTCGKEETFDLPVLTDTSYKVTTTKAATYEEKGSITYEYTKDSQTIVVATADIAKLTYKLPAGITSKSFDDAEVVYYYQNASNVIHESTEKPAASYYNGKFYDSLGSALYASRLNTEDEEVVIYMKPNSTSECGGYFGTILENVTVYGNGATVAESDRLAIEDSDANLLTANITINIYDLNNAVVWGTRKTTYTVNINAFNTDFDRININNPSSICDVNINLSKCKFIGEVQNENLNSSIYFNTTLLTQCNGTITLDGCEFENLAVGLNLNHKIAGSQVVTITNTTFKDVAVSKVSSDGEEAYFAAIRMYQKVEGATATLNVSGCTFTYSEGKTSVNNYDILLNKIHNGKEAQGTITYKVVGDALIYTGVKASEITE